MHSVKGFLLVSVMIFLLLLTLMVTETLEIAQVQNRMAGYQHESSAFANQANYALKVIEERLKINEMNLSSFTADINLNNSTWWQQHSDQININNILVWYYIDQWQENPCLQITGEAHIGVKLYRILLKISDAYADTKIILQAIYAIPAKLFVICKKKIVIIPAGQQSWHEVRSS